MKFNHVKVINLLSYYILPLLFFIIYFAQLIFDPKEAYRFSLDLGVWSWRLLIVIMFLKPAMMIFPKITVLKKLFLRKQYGVLVTWLFIIHLLGAIIHKELFSISDYFGFTNYIFWGLLAGIIMLILGLTSNVRSIKILNKLIKRGWKKLHRTAYLLFVFVVIHAYLISDNINYLIILSLYLLLKIFEFSKVKLHSGFFYAAALVLLSIFLFGFFSNLYNSESQIDSLSDQYNNLKEEYEAVIKDYSDDDRDEDECEDRSYEDEYEEGRDECEDDIKTPPEPVITPEPTPEPTPELIPDPNPEPVPDSTTLIPNKAELVTECISLCEVDREAYCLEERTLVFDENTYTEGNCRVFSKYVKSGFRKCQGFCEQYGDETGCNIDGKRDPNCDGR